MKHSILKAKIEQAQWEFDEFDVKRALMEMVKLAGKGKPNQTVDVDWESENGHLKFFLTVTYKTEETEENDNPFHREDRDG